jgi:hypothetical protein
MASKTEQDKTGNGHSAETVRSEFFTQAIPPTARESDCQQDQLHTLVVSGRCRFTPALETGWREPCREPCREHQTSIVRFWSAMTIKFCFRRGTPGGRPAERGSRFPSIARPGLPILNLGMFLSTKCNVRINLRSMVRSISLRLRLGCNLGNRTELQWQPTTLAATQRTGWTCPSVGNRFIRY